jgi:hypothetical protein
MIGYGTICWRWRQHDAPKRCILPHHYTESQLRRTQLESLLSLKPKVPYMTVLCFALSCMIVTTTNFVGVFMCNGWPPMYICSICYWVSTGLHLKDGGSMVLKCYLTISLHCVTTQRTVTWIFIAMKTLHPLHSCHFFYILIYENDPTKFLRL